jgi:hypothetical protein
MHNVVQFPGNRLRPDLREAVGHAILLLEISLVQTAGVIASCPAGRRKLELDKELLDLRFKLDNLRHIALSIFPQARR